MLTYNMGQRGNTPLYVYLYQCIKSDMETGIIKAGEKLPSKRSLAEHLKISVITVQNAYEQLIAEGYISSQEKRGYFAAAINPLTKPTQQLPPWGIKEAAPSPYLIDLCENSINLRSFPFSVWARQMREVLSEMEGELLKRMPSAGVMRLREAIADFLYHYRGMRVAPEQIVIGAGTEYLYGLIIKLLGRDLSYALEDPGYRKISDIYRSEGAACHYIGLDDSGIKIDDLQKSRADIVHVCPSHHFPTGLVMPVKRRMELLNWANQGNRYIIEDDYDSEFRFSGKIIPTLLSADNNERVIYMNTFSKTIAPSIRISFMVLPAHLAHAYRQKMGNFSCTVSAFEQYTLAKFIEGGYFERHINRMRKLYRNKRDYLITAVKELPIFAGSQILGQESGLHFLIAIRSQYTDEEIVAKAAEIGIKISFLSQYCVDSKNVQNSMLVINYSGVEIEQIDAAVVVLKSQ